MEIIDNLYVKYETDDIQYIECKYPNNIDTYIIKIHNSHLIINEVIPTCDLDFYFTIMIDMYGNLLILYQSLYGNKRICSMVFDSIKYNSNQLKLTINLIELFKIMFRKIDIINYTYEFQKFELIKKHLNRDENDNFNYDFKYKTYFLSTKSKIENLSDDRSPIISVDGNLINCFTGKIQGIYLVEDYLKKEYNL